MLQLSIIQLSSMILGRPKGQGSHGQRFNGSEESFCESHCHLCRPQYMVAVKIEWNWKNQRKIEGEKKMGCREIKECKYCHFYRPTRKGDDRTSEVPAEVEERWKTLKEKIIKVSTHAIAFTNSEKPKKHESHRKRCKQWTRGGNESTRQLGMQRIEEEIRFSLLYTFIFRRWIFDYIIGLHVIVYS